MDERHIVFDWLKNKCNRDTVPTMGFKKELVEYIKATATCFYFDDEIVYKTEGNYFKLKTIDNQ